MIAWLEKAIAGASGNVWLGIVALGVAAIAGLYLFGRSLARFRLIENTPTSRARSAAQGFVELSGRVYCLPQQETVAKLTGIPCVWYEFKVEKKTRKNNRDTPAWETIDSGSSHALFELRDGDARCLIDPDGAKFIGVDERTWYGGPQRQVPWLWERRWPQPSGEYRYFERRLAVGTVTYVWGELATRSLTARHSELVTTLLREWKQDRLRLVQRFDANQDGVVDADEWEAARIAAQKEVRAVHAAAPEAAPSVVRRPRAASLPFMISAKSEAEIRREFRREIALAMALFVAAGGTLVWTMIVRLEI